MRSGDTLKYPEYLSAAKRHDQACSVLKEKIEGYKAHPSHNVKLEQLAVSLYYLSGYILECSLKFKILEVSNFCPRADVNKHECKKIGIEYNKEFGIHSLPKLQELLISKVTDINCSASDCKVIDLLTSWHPRIRYQDAIIPVNEAEEFYKHTKFVMRKVQ
jgi:hypothetical protein